MAKARNAATAHLGRNLRRADASEDERGEGERGGAGQEQAVEEERAEDRAKDGRRPAFSDLLNQAARLFLAAARQLHFRPSAQQIVVHAGQLNA